MAVVTWTGSVSTTYSTDGNWDTGSVPGDGDDVVIPDTSSINACNVDSNDSCNSLTVSSNGEIGSDNGSKLAILGEADGTGATTNGFAVNIDGVITNNGGTSLDLDIRTPAATTVDLYAQGGGKLRNVIINHASCVATLGALIDITGDLTITAGELNTNSGSNYAVTVAGRTDIGPGSGGADQATLTCNASTVSLGSGYTGGYALLGNGTVNFGTGTNTVGAINTHSPSGITKTSGTITFDTQKTGSQSIGPTVTSNNTHFDFGTSTVNFDLSGGAGVKFAIEQHTGSSKTLTITAATVNYKSDGYIYQNNTDTNIFKIIGDLVIDASKTLETYYDNADDFGSKLQVTGDVTLNGTLNAYSASNPKPMDFGSLTIGGSGTYKATSGTTTITDETTGGYGLINSGTYTHNKGKLKIDFNTPNKNAHTIIQVNDLYDLEIDMNASNYEVKFDDTSGNATNILNNLDITQGVFESKDNGDTLTIHGLTRITSNGTFMPDANHDTNKIIHNGLVTNSGTYKINDGTTVKMNGGIRNLGTITVA